MNALANGDSGYSKSTSDHNKPPTEDEISDRLLHVPPGHHYLILYSNIETMRKVCGNYVKKQLEEQLILSFCFFP